MGKLYKRSQKKGSPWWADFVDRNGLRVRKSTKVTDKQRAGEIMTSWEGTERLIQSGARLPTKHAERLETILQLFETSKVASGRSQQHVTRTGQLIRAVAAFGGWELLGNISDAGLNAFSKSLLDAGQSARSVGAVVTAVRSFCRWCVRQGHLLSDPTITVSKPSTMADRRIERRMILPDEWKWVRASLELTRCFRNGQSSKERLLMYRLAIETGLRASEVLSLRVSSLQLRVKEPSVRIRADITKNGRVAQQYVSDSLAADLKTHIREKAAGARVFNIVSRNELARSLRSDVEAARGLWLATLADDDTERESDFLLSPNSQGEVIDFHALRHTCGAWLTMRGIPLSQVREVMRHSTIRLTVDCYGHLAPDATASSRQLLGGML